MISPDLTLLVRQECHPLLGCADNFIVIGLDPEVVERQKEVGGRAIESVLSHVKK